MTINGMGIWIETDQGNAVCRTVHDDASPAPERKRNRLRQRVGWRMLTMGARIIMGRKQPWELHKLNINL